jgi:anti-sigma B factor antagonist
VARPFSIETREVDGVTVFGVEGDLDLSTAPRLCGRIDQAFKERGPRVLVDLTNVEFCDSTGLRALFGAVQEARVRRAPLRIVMPASPAATRVFDLVGASEFLPLVGDAKTGLAQLASLARR